MDGFSYMSLDEWVAWIREIESVDQSNEDPEEWSVNQRFAEDRLIAASSRINDALAAGGWQTPLAAPYPPSIIQACAWIAWFNGEVWGTIRETVDRHYEESINWLNSLAKGTAVLTGGDGLPIPKIALSTSSPLGSVYSGSLGRNAVNPWLRLPMGERVPPKYRGE